MHRTRAFLGIAGLLLALASGPTQAQTASSFDEAVRINTALGIELCARHMSQVQNTVNALANARFTYSSEANAAETRHLFEAPSGTVRVTVIQGQTAPECFVNTTHMGLTAAVPFLGAVLNQRFPGRFVPDRTGIACISYQEAGVIGLSIVAVPSLSGPGGCLETGETIFIISHQV